VKVELRRHCRSPSEASALVAAVQVDTPDFVRLRSEGRVLEVDLTAPSAASARATLEDLVACLRAAEKALEAASG
jgi:hypothetical protein